MLEKHLLRLQDRYTPHRVRLIDRVVLLLLVLLLQALLRVLRLRGRLLVLLQRQDRHGARTSGHAAGGRGACGAAGKPDKRGRVVLSVWT